MIKAFDFSIDLTPAILWQYEDAAKLVELVESKQAFATENHTDFWNDWYTDVFNIDTCNFFGAAVWAIILELALDINQPPSGDGIGWGFGEFRKNFENGNFVTTGQFAQAFTLEQRRILLKMRYQRLTTGATIPEINKILFDAFGAGVYAVRTGEMAMEYIFPNPIEPWVAFSFNSMNVFPTPAAVSATIV